MTARTRTLERQRIIAKLTEHEWRHGHWSNPVTAALGVYVTGVFLHMTGVSPWLVALGGAVFIGTFVTVTVARDTRTLGVVYSAAVSMAVTGWLTWAAGHPTLDIFDWATTRQALAALVVGATPLTVVYAMLVHDRSAAEAEGERIAAQLSAGRARWHDACDRAGIKGWHYESEEPTPGGRAVTMRIDPGGTTYRRALDCVEQLEVCLAAPYHGAVKLERGSDVTAVVIQWNERDMLAETVPLPDDMSATSVLEPMTVGVHEDRVPARITYGYRSTLTIGQRDAGKSNYANVKVANFVRADNVLLWAVCFKQGSFLRPWLAPYAAGQTIAPAFDWVTLGLPGLVNMLDALDRIGDERARRRVGDKITPTRELPAIRLIIDELADALADLRNEAIAARLVKALRKHRSEGIDFDLLTQRGTISFLGAHARDLATQVGVINLLRVKDSGEVWTTLGMDRASVGGVDPARFQHNGTMLTIADGSRLAPTKTFRVENEQIPARAIACAPYRPVLEPSAVAAAGPAYARRWQTDEVRALLVEAAKLVGGQFRPAHAAPAAVGRAPIPQQHTPPPVNVVPLHPLPDLSDPRPVLEQMRFRPIDGRDILVREYGPVEGERRWQHALGLTVLEAMRKILAASEHGALPTRAVLDRLAAAPVRPWGDLDADGLARLLRPHDVRPVQLGRRFDGNPRGYLLEDVAAAVAPPVAAP